METVSDYITKWGTKTFYSECPHKDRSVSTHSDAAFDLQAQQSVGEFKAPLWTSAGCAGMCGTTGYWGGGDGRLGEGVRNADVMLQQPLSLWEKTRGWDSGSWGPIRRRFAVLLECWSVATLHQRQRSKLSRSDTSGQNLQLKFDLNFEWQTESRNVCLVFFWISLWMLRGRGF